MRFRTGLSVGLVLALVGGCSTSGPEESSTTSPLPDSVFPQGGFWSETIKTNPAVTIGTLENGLTYYVQQNTRPGGRAQLRLAVDAGSLMEDPEQSGGAHFLEHMMFNGTEKYPSTAIVKVLEGFGMQMGPEINAYTSYDETVYELDVPTSDLDTLKEGFVVLREWASNATIDQAEVDTERGVIIEEWRQGGESFEGRLDEAYDRLVLANTPYEGKAPIGDIEIVRELDAETLRAFYEKWYRPDRMAVVAVGDFDESWVVETITEVFGDLERPAEVVESPDRTVGSVDSMRVEVLSDPEASTGRVSALFPVPSSPVVTNDDQRRKFATWLGFMVLDRRFEDLIARGEIPAISVLTSLEHRYTRSVSYYGSSFTVEPESVEVVLSAMATEYERILRHGIGGSELERQIEVLKSWEEDDYRAKDSTQDWEFAGSYVYHYLQGEPVPAADDRFSLAETILDQVTVEQVEECLRNVIEGHPLVLLAAPSGTSLPNPGDIDDRWEEPASGEIDPWEDDETELDSLIVPPDPVEPLYLRSVEGTTAIEFEFENGIRVLAIETDIHAGFVTMEGLSVGGQSAYEVDDVVEAAIIPDVVSRSGIASFDRITLDRMLTGHSVTVTPYVDIVYEGFTGEAAAEDIELLFQLIHLYMTEPRVDEVQTQIVLSEWRPYVEDPSATPALAAEVERSRARYGDNPWYEPLPSIEAFDDFDLDRASEIYRERFVGAGDFVFVFVGDVPVEEITRLAYSYLGSLATDKKNEEVVDRLPDPVEEPITRKVLAGTGEQGAVSLSYSSHFDHDSTDRLLLTLLQTILENRLKDRLREELGATYGASVTFTVFDLPRPGVDVVIEIGNDPDRVDEVGSEARAAIDSLAESGPTNEELSTAVNQLVMDLELFANPTIAEALMNTTQRDEGFREFLTRSVTLAEFADWDRLDDVTRRVFDGEGYVEIHRLPVP